MVLVFVGIVFVDTNDDQYTLPNKFFSLPTQQFPNFTRAFRQLFSEFELYGLNMFDIMSSLKFLTHSAMLRLPVITNGSAKMLQTYT